MKYTNGVAADYLSACGILDGIIDKYKVHFIRTDAAYDIKRVYKEFGKHNNISIIWHRKDIKICLVVTNYHKEIN